MGKPRFVCEYCNKSFEDSQEARQRHNRGRNHKTNVKLWYDSFTDQERHATASASGVAQANSANSAWTPVTSLPANGQGPTQSPFVQQNLPPSMHPAPPEAFYYCQADWG